ncbi:MAG: endonuclease/exonuclease/phosphatase family protein [Pseudobacteriovorax sp.]|nr:endonuclease/exonuclease/phosphatase family protein [Pseudobacteriovorax sp.]
MLTYHKYIVILLSLALFSCVDSPSPQEDIEVPGQNQTTDPADTENPKETDPGQTNPDPDDLEIVPPVEDDGANKIGDDTSFEFATWNLREFPKANNETISTVAGHILNWDLDVVAVQEILSDKAFSDLVKALPGYEGKLINNDDFMKTGLIYKSNTLKVNRQEVLYLPTESRAFPRDPLLVNTSFLPTGESIDFIVVHLKAKSGTSNVERRTLANAALVKYTDSLLENNPDRKIVILGDFNSDLLASEMDFWRESEFTYEIETTPLKSANKISYYTNFKSLIDHIVTVNFSVDEMLIPEPLVPLSKYESVVSDHFPVIAIDE